MLISKEVEVKWHGSTKEYYINKGYIFTFTGDKFNVKVEDLSEGGKQRVFLKCDYQKDGCKDIYDVRISNYYSSNIKSVIHKDCCNNPSCMKEKRKESVELTYGYQNVNQIPEIINKRKLTCNELYGGNSPICSDEVREKSKITLQNKYNVTNISQLEETKQKKKDSSIKHFGVENPMQDAEIQNKLRQAVFDKYGVNNYLSLEKPHELSKKCVSINME